MAMPFFVRIDERDQVFAVHGNDLFQVLVRPAAAADLDATDLIPLFGGKFADEWKINNTGGSQGPGG